MKLISTFGTVLINNLLITSDKLNSWETKKDGRFVHTYRMTVET